MRRREFIALISSAAAGWPLAARAQQSVKPHRIGYLHGGTEAGDRGFLDEFKAGMRDLGHIEGHDFVLDTRFADGHFERLPSLAKELLALNPDVLFVVTTPANLAAKAATSTTPIVMVGVADPIGAGLIPNLARPGGNITGITNVVAELTGKRLEILKEIVPTASKIAVMANPGDPNMPLQMRNAEPVAKSLHVQLEPVLAIRSEDDLPSVFEDAKRARAVLRVFAISSGFVGASYSLFWLSDPVGTFWEMAFTFVNIGQIALITYRNGSSRFNDEERAFYTQVVPTLEPYQARRLMKIGTWLDGSPGTELTRQGVSVSHLIFLRSGEASVSVDGRRVGVCNEGNLIGEISIRTGKPATATVTANVGIRYLAIERDALHCLMKVDPEIALAIDVTNRGDLESKLVRMNQAALQPAA